MSIEGRDIGVETTKYKYGVKEGGPSEKLIQRL